MGKHSQENAELKIKLKGERIGRAELQAENQSILDALRAMEQSLVEHENFIIELQGENAYQNMMHECRFENLAKDIAQNKRTISLIL